MKTFKTGWYLLYLGGFLITVGILFGSAVAEALKNHSGIAAMNKVVAEVKPKWKGGDKKQFSLDTIDRVKKNLKEQQVTYTVESPDLQQITHWSGSRHEAKVCGTDYSFAMFHQLDFINGGFFPATGQSKFVKTAVISEAFSWAFFRTVNVTGMTLNLYGEVFKIIGVFSTNQDILHTLGNAALPDIVIPAETMLRLDSTAYIDSIAVAGGESAIFGETKELVASVLRQMSIDETRIDVTDFHTVYQAIRQKPWVTVYVAAAMTMMVWCTRLFDIFKTMSAEFRDVHEHHHPFTNIRYSVLLSVGDIILITTGFILMFFLLKELSFDFYIPPKYVPGETLNFRKYTELMKESLQATFIGVSEEATASVKLLQSASLVTDWIFYGTFVPGFFLCWVGKRITHGGSGNEGMRLVQGEKVSERKSVVHGEKVSERKSVVHGMKSNEGMRIWIAGGMITSSIIITAVLCFICGLPAIVDIRKSLIGWMLMIAYSPWRGTLNTTT